MRDLSDTTFERELLKLVKLGNHADVASHLYHNGGFGATQIARYLDVTPSTVHRWVNPAYAGRTREHNRNYMRRKRIELDQT